MILIQFAMSVMYEVKIPLHFSPPNTGHAMISSLCELADNWTSRKVDCSLKLCCKISLTDV